jgi:HK97 gp10 family phage protein
MNIDVSAKTTIKPTAEIARKAATALKELMYVMEGEAVRKCPVDTGRLRASIHVTKNNEYEYTLADGVDYGIHQEFGTVNMRAQPFFRPALALAKIRARSIISKHLRGA